MGKYYDEPLIEIINMQLNDIVRTSTGNDPFDDGYQDPILGFGE
jgi:hypothetical protein